MKKCIKTKKKGFTLIELLAVIVVLAILALIAVPIVLNIIKDARNNSNKRSIESYVRSIDYAVSEYMSENPDVEIVTWDDVKDRVEYKGKVECQWEDNLSSISQAGEITLHGCKVNNKTNSIYGYVAGKVVEEEIGKYKKYSVGDEITYKGMKFYVISPSDTKQDYVTLLKDEPLTVDEVNTYGEGHINRYTFYYPNQTVDKNGYGGIAYYSSETCGYESSSNSFIQSGCSTSYDTSDIKYSVDNWSFDKIDQEDLIKDSLGYKARLITLDELVNNLGFSKKDGEYNYTSTPSLTPDFVSKYFGYWTMTPYDAKYDYEKFNVYHVNNNHLNYCSNGSCVIYGLYDYVRPVINLKKSAIKSTN